MQNISQDLSVEQTSKGLQKFDQVQGRNLSQFGHYPSLLSISYSLICFGYSLYFYDIVSSDV